MFIIHNVHRPMNFLSSYSSFTLPHIMYVSCVFIRDVDKRLLLKEMNEQMNFTVPLKQTVYRQPNALPATQPVTSKH